MSYRAKTISSFIILTVGLTLWADMALVRAQQTVELTNPLDTSEAGKVADTAWLLGKTGDVIKAILGIIGVIALVMFIYGGILWLTSGGATDKIEKGKKIFVWSTIGLAVIFSSYLLVNFVITGLTVKK